MIKPLSYYVFKSRIQDVLSIQEKEFSIQRFPQEMINNEQKDLFRISRIIQRIGIPVGTKGYPFVRYAISLVMQYPEMLHSITQKLYPAIAENFKTTTACVERNIRHAIETAWNKGDLTYIEELFGYTVDAERGKPTNSAFIATIKDHIELTAQKVD